MKTVALIGAYDKTDLILYMARILAVSNKRVLVVDATEHEKLRYIVPSITPTKTYISEFQAIDFAIGFDDINRLWQYLGVEEGEDKGYDIVLLDVDKPEAIQNFGIGTNTTNLFITTFDLFSIKRGLAVLENLQENMKIKKVLVTKQPSKEESEYIDFLSYNLNVTWDDDVFNFPLEVGNFAVTVENQTIHRIKIRGLTSNYKYALQMLIEMIFADEVPSKDITRTMKILEKEV